MPLAAKRAIRNLCRRWRPGLRRHRFLSKESGGKEGAGGKSPRRPPIRGFTAAESCTDKARTGRASTPGSFFAFVTGAAAPRAARAGHPAGPDSRCAVPGAPNGAPAATQRSGRRGERRPSEGNELSRLRGSERSAAWADDAIGAMPPKKRGACGGCMPGAALTAQGWAL